MAGEQGSEGPVPGALNLSVGGLPLFGALSLSGGAQAAVSVSLSVLGDGGGGWGGAATAASLLSLQHFNGREHKSRELARAARFPPTQTSAQDKVRRGRAPGQQHNKSPSASPGSLFCGGSCFECDQRKEEPCAIRLGTEDALLTAPVAHGHPRFKYEETRGQRAA